VERPNRLYYLISQSKICVILADYQLRRKIGIRHRSFGSKRTPTVIGNVDKQHKYWRQVQAGAKHIILRTSIVKITYHLSSCTRAVKEAFACPVTGTRNAAYEGWHHNVVLLYEGNKKLKWKFWPSYFTSVPQLVLYNWLGLSTGWFRRKGQYTGGLW
jgi:hypothetical protein